MATKKEKKNPKSANKTNYVGPSVAELLIIEVVAYGVELMF